MHNRLFIPETSNTYFLFGQRGCGKSFLLRSHYKNNPQVVYIDLLSDGEYYRFSSLQGELLKIANVKTNKIIVIDEVQRIPELLNQVHKIIEEIGTQFVLSGSSSRKLKRKGANMLAGRAFTYKLFPFTHIELGENFQLDKFLQWGGLPKIYNYDREQDKAEYLYSYINTYLQEEIKVEQEIRNIEPFMSFMRVAAQMNGQTLNVSNIAKDVGLSWQTISTYFEIINDSYLGFFLEAYDKSIRKRQKESPKFYFHDTGVVRSLLNLAEIPVHAQSFEYGNLFETFLISEIMRIAEYQRKRYTFSYLKDSNENEIDLIIERPGLPIVLVEIKSKSNVQERDVLALNRFVKDFPVGTQAICLSNEMHAKQIGEVICYNWRDGMKFLFGEVKLPQS